MKRIYQRASGWAEAVAWYFLGVRPTPRKQWDKMGFGGQKLHKNHLIINAQENEERGVLDFLEISAGPIELGIVLITPRLRLAPIGSKKDLLNWCLVATPNYLDDVSAIAEHTRAIRFEHVLLIVADISMLPCRKELQWESRAQVCDRHHAREFKKVLASLIKLTADTKFRLVFVDNENTLGKKNDALLRRTFFHNLIIKRKA